MKKMRKLFSMLIQKRHKASQLAQMKQLKSAYDEWAGYMNKPLI